MDETTKELVCLSASIAGHCRPCFQYHFKKAQELGIPMSEIEQVIAIAKEISASGDKHIVEFARKKLKTYNVNRIENG